MRSSRHRKQRFAGFTLIELMIVVAIIAIGAGLAIPAYNDYVKRGQIQEGTTFLADGRVKMEQFFQDNRTYVGGPCPNPTKHFTFACDGQLATFTITATGGGNLTGFAYTVTHDAVQGSTTPWGNCVKAWIIRKGDVCPS